MLRRVRGAFSIAAVSADEPDTIVAARRSTPLVLGLHDGMALLASDIPALIGHTRHVFALADDQVAVLTARPHRGDDARRRAGRARAAHHHLGPRGGTEGRLRRLHVQGDARAAPGGGRHAAGPARAGGRADPRRDAPRAPTTCAPSTRSSSSPAARATTRPGGQVRHRALGQAAGRGRHRQRVPLPRPGAERAHAVRRGLPVGRDARHLRGHARGGAPRGQGAGRLQRGRLVHGPRGRRRALHPGRPRDRRRLDQVPPGPDRRARGARPVPGPDHAARCRRRRSTRSSTPWRRCPDLWPRR